MNIFILSLMVRVPNGRICGYLGGSLLSCACCSRHQSRQQAPDFQKLPVELIAAIS